MRESGNTGRNSTKERKLCSAGSPLIETESVRAMLVCPEGVKQPKDIGVPVPGGAESDCA